jgi:hypothetical protein
MPHFIAIETCSFGLPTNIPLWLTCFERSLLLHKISFGFEPRALELFELFLSWVVLPLVPFSFMARLLVKELIVLLEPKFFTPWHIQEAFHFHDGLG